MNKVNPINNISGNMSRERRRKARVRAVADERKNEIKNEFLFDDKLHSNLAKYQFGYNPYQE